MPAENPLADLAVMHDGNLCWPVLDHGFVRVVDLMGDDDAIVQAARISYGAGTKSLREDRGLIDYLMEHKHTSPFEMCLHGDTRIPTYPCPGATVKHYTIRDLANAFTNKGKGSSWVKLVNIRCVDPVSGVVYPTKIRNAWRNGVNITYRTTVNWMQRSVVTTDTHPFLCEDGIFRPLSQLRIGDRIALNGGKATSEEVVAHVCQARLDGKSLKEVARETGLGETTIHRISRKIGINRVPRKKGGFRVSEDTVTRVLQLRKEGRNGEDIAKEMNVSMGTVYNICHKTGTFSRVPKKTGYFNVPPEKHVDPRHVARTVLRKNNNECALCNEPARDRHHIDENPYNNELSNLVWLCAKHHRHIHIRSVLRKVVYSSISSIEMAGEAEVYDLEVDSPHHCFVAEGFVVHNCEVKLHVKMPIFVARQWVRHRTASMNEYSARYSTLKDTFYVPQPEHIAKQASTNRQGRKDLFSSDESLSFIENIKDTCNNAFDTYQTLLTKDVARELARVVLPLSSYTEFYWKIDLHNLLHFLELRLDTHAQFEIRRYAEVIWNNIVKLWVPAVADSFIEHRLEALHIGRTERDLLLDLARSAAKAASLSPEDVKKRTGLTKRRADRLIALLGLGEEQHAERALPGALPHLASDARGARGGDGTVGEVAPQGGLRDPVRPDGTGAPAPGRADGAGRPPARDGSRDARVPARGEVSNANGERGS
jgi:flavin-dependent thymidylate synthase